MRVILAGLFVAVVASVGVAQSADKEVLYGPEAAWVAPVPSPTAGETPEGAAYRVVYSDNQIHLGPKGLEVYQAFRFRILKPEALSIGNVSVSWNPSGGGATVHHLRIIREGQPTDVLANTRFNVIQREGALENAILNGNLTATIQVPDLQVGDELEFAVTTQYKDPTLGDHLFGFTQLAPTGNAGAFRARVVWPKTSRVGWKATPDIANIKPVALRDDTELVYELRDPHAAVTADGAPDRVNLRRFIEMSDFESWKDLSARFWSLFNKASVLKDDSSVRKEIARIAEADKDPLRRLKAALQLVQDRIRYVYVGLNGGNYMPASADETWERKFGDCKAKTALLLGVLRELGISAEAVLVDVTGGDGLNEHLPSPLAFNHVVVRASVSSVAYWLDGTRQGDSRLTPVPPWPLRWVLPARSTEGDLERVPLKPPTSPLELTYIFVDASKGFVEQAQVEMQQIMRGDQAVQLRSALSVMSSENADRALLAYWRKGNAWLEPTTASWHYDEDRGAIRLIVKGLGKPDWEGDDTNGRKLDVLGAGFYKPDELHRPADQDQQAPWQLSFPKFGCWATAIRLPENDGKWKWDFSSDPIDVHVGGVHYWRTADLRDGVIRTVMSRNTEAPELTALQAAQLNKDIPSFNHYMSSVFQIELGTIGTIRVPTDEPPFPLDMDWTRPDVPCGQPSD